MTALRNRIEKHIELAAPIGRVWRALTDHTEFGAWFRVDLDGPFVVGDVARGRTTFPGYEGKIWQAKVVEMEPERRFAFTWCPYPHDDGRDFASAPQTLVEFQLEPTARGTRLTITESGFDALPDDPLRVDALRNNAKGWDIQAESLAAHVQS